MQNPPLPKIRGAGFKLSDTQKEALQRLANEKGEAKWSKKETRAQWLKFKQDYDSDISPSAFRNHIQRSASTGDSQNFRWTAQYQKWINQHNTGKGHKKLYDTFVAKVVPKGKKPPTFGAFKNRLIEKRRQEVSKKKEMERTRVEKLMKRERQLDQMDRTRQRGGKDTEQQENDEILMDLARCAMQFAAVNADEGGGCSSGQQRTPTYTTGSCLTAHKYPRSTRDLTPPPPPPPLPQDQAGVTVSPAASPLLSGSDTGGSPAGAPVGSPVGSPAGAPVGSPTGSAADLLAGLIAVSPEGSLGAFDVELQNASPVDSSSAWMGSLATLSP